ncbi:MAG TPA: hypothetical protein VJP76_06630 [Candidatus Tumulicola sp.]|nr:hypothetical protein [Candidatus Tumulicola sp.]
MTAHPWEPRLARFEGAYDQVADRLNGVDRRLESLSVKIDGLRSDVTSGQRRTIAFVSGSWITLLAAILLHR